MTDQKYIEKGARVTMSSYLGAGTVLSIDDDGVARIELDAAARIVYESLEKLQIADAYDELSIGVSIEPAPYKDLFTSPNTDHTAIETFNKINNDVMKTLLTRIGLQDTYKLVERGKELRIRGRVIPSPIFDKASLKYVAQLNLLHSAFDGQSQLGKHITLKSLGVKPLHQLDADTIIFWLAQAYRPATREQALEWFELIEKDHSGYYKMLLMSIC